MNRSRGKKKEERKKFYETKMKIITEKSMNFGVNTIINVHYFDHFVILKS
jgi:hypothetical protein